MVCMEMLPSCGHGGNGISEGRKAGGDLGTRSPNGAVEMGSRILENAL